MRTGRRWITAAALAILAAAACGPGAPGAMDQTAGQRADSEDSTPSGAISAAELVDLTAAVGGSHSPKWSPDGSRITFVAGGGLGAVDHETGDFEMLADDLSLSGVGSLGAPQPIWAPDGGWVAYTSDKGGAPDIWLWRDISAPGVDGALEVQRTTLSARANGLAWSPDGSRIAFSGDRYGNMDIWTVSVTDGQVHRLTDDPRYEGYPSWTPRWQPAALRAHGRPLGRPRRDRSGPGRQQPAHGRSRHGVLRLPRRQAFGAAQVSPDGETVLFRSQRSGWLNFWVAPRDGSAEPRPIAASDHDQSDARWSPDGSWISYTENRDGVHSLRLVSADGSQRKALVDTEVGAALRPEWSPDGGRISYTFETPTRPAELFVIDVESGGEPPAVQHGGAGSAEKLHMPEKVAYPSSDGLTVPAYVHRPPDAEPGERFPGVVWIHGGPTSQFDDQYRRHQQVHFFAQRGYVVLMPNIREARGTAWSSRISTTAAGATATWRTCLQAWTS